MKNNLENLSFSGLNKNKQYIQNIDNCINLIKSKDLKILDIGCGDALILDFLIKKKKIYYTGIDISKQNILNATRNKNKKNFVLDNYIKKKFNKKFDMIISYSSLNVISNFNVLIDKMSLEIKKKGLIVICVPYSCLRTHLYVYLRFVINFLSKIGFLALISFIYTKLFQLKYSNNQIKDRLIYMTMTPKFLWNTKNKKLAKNKNFKIYLEEKECPEIIGKLSHKIIILQKI
jgi:SAM-dependent methyltransferase